MRLAVLSDIHGNLLALEAVLADAARREVDLMVNLGDALSGPLQPAATADRLASLRLPTIAGNHERQLLTLPRERMNDTDAFTAAQLTDAHRAWLSALPRTLWLSPEIFACHGTPDSDLGYFLETIGPDGLREATDEEVALRAGALPAAVILCGHTHLSRARQLPDGRLLVNPGAVGLQAYLARNPYPHAVATGTPHARYALLARDDAGTWSADLLTVAYDWESAARLAAEHGRPDWAIALRTGFPR